MPAYEYDLDTLVLLIVPLSSLRIAFSVFIRHLLSTSYRSLSGDSLVRIRYGFRISTLNVPILFFLPCQKTSDVLSQCLRKTFYYFSSVAFSFAKAFLPRQMKCPQKLDSVINCLMEGGHFYVQREAICWRVQTKGH